MTAIVKSEVLSSSGVDRIIFMEGGLGEHCRESFFYIRTKWDQGKGEIANMNRPNITLKKSFRGRRKEVKPGSSVLKYNPTIDFSSSLLISRWTFDQFHQIPKLPSQGPSNFT